MDTEEKRKYVETQVKPALRRAAIAGVNKQQMAKHLGVSGVCLSDKTLNFLSEHLLARIVDFAQALDHPLFDSITEKDILEFLKKMVRKHSQKKVAQALGVDYKRIYYWRIGKAAIPLKRYKQIMEIETLLT